MSTDWSSANSMLSLDFVSPFQGVMRERESMGMGLAFNVPSMSIISGSKADSATHDLFCTGGDRDICHLVYDILS